MEISKMRHGLGNEHPLCDRVQLPMVIMFFVIWGIDSLGFLMFGYSTVIFQALIFPPLLIGTILSLVLSFHLISKSHKAVLEQVQDPPQLVNSGVNAWVRHPMYLGILFFCLAFMFVSVSLLSIGIWIAFFVFYDRMAAFEEKSLIEILGEPYIAYQKRVAKWLPGVC
jgi:protein-S-isoprenylcysteine O-methyltransferase Ste14